jgi:putative SOS response-associated peptidase YedK
MNSQRRKTQGEEEGPLAVHLARVRLVRHRGIVRADPVAGEAFTLLTCPPGPDITPYHNRQVVLLSPRDCFGWLDPAGWAEEFVRPLAAGSLSVTAG